MSKKGENIYKRKDDRWEGRYIKFYNQNGKAKYGYVYAKTYSEVKSRLVLVKSDLGTNAGLAGSRTCLYSEVLDAWMQSARINTKESTYARYTHLVDAHIRPCLTTLFLMFGIGRCHLRLIVFSPRVLPNFSPTGDFLPKTEFFSNSLQHRAFRDFSPSMAKKR